MLVRQRELYPSVTELLVSNLPFRGIVLDVRRAKAGTMLAFFLCYILQVGFADPVWETRLLRVSFDYESSVL